MIRYKIAPVSTISVLLSPPLPPKKGDIVDFGRIVLSNLFADFRGWE